VLLGFVLMPFLFGFTPAVKAGAPEPEPSVPQARGLLALELVSAHELEVHLARWLQAEFEQAGSHVQAELIGSWGGLPQTLTNVRASIARQTKVPDGWQVSLMVLAIGQEGVENKVDFRFKVRSLHPVWVALASMRKGERLTCQQFQQAQRSGKPAAMAWQLPCESLEGLQLRKPLAAGDVLMALNVTKPAAVQEQQAAVVTAQLGSVQVQGAGVVLSDAEVGQMVTVRMNGQAAVIQGLVTAPGRVQVVGEAK